jgi:hypothetical protein
MTDLNYNSNNIREQLKLWLKNNILQQVVPIVDILMKQELINIEDIENFYKTYNRDDFDDEEQYENQLNDPEPQNVYEWYLVTKTGYDTFLKLGDTVFKWENMYFWGRTCFGQLIHMDYQYNSDENIRNMFNL